MEPKTALHKKVVALSAKLPAITDKQKDHAFKSCLLSYVGKSRKTLFCPECSHSWTENDSGIMLLKIEKGCTCPSCLRKLKYAENMKGTFRDSAYYSIITTQDDMQVVRMFFVAKDMKKGQFPEMWISEVMQHWIDQSGKVTTMSKTVQGLSRYYDQWIFQSSLEVRPQSYKSTLRYDIGAFKTYPGKRVIPVIRRNGFTGRFYDLNQHQFLSEILSSKYVETLLKTKQIEIMKYYITKNKSKVIEFWPTIRICIRNNYKAKDASIYFDYLDLLRFFGRDLHNPKYVCPADVTKEHDRLVRRKQDLDRKKKLAEMRKKLDKEQVTYQKNKGKFFGLVFCKGNILVKTIESVEEIMIEGDKLHHCVFTNEYHKKPDSLIMSARINNEPVETIELSLKSMKVLQSRGFHNKHSKYHNKILDVVNSNIPQIAERLRVKNHAEVI